LGVRPVGGRDRAVANPLIVGGGRGIAWPAIARPERKDLRPDVPAHVTPAGTESLARPLATALAGSPLFFEPVPPSARAKPARATAELDAVAELVRAIPRIDALDIPELVDENHEGRPLYRTSDPRVFGRALADRTGREVVVNKVVAHLENPDAISRWATETVGMGIRHVVLVGGTSRYIPYPGPAVVEANRLCRPVLERAGGLVGNITIPQREGEPHRMLSKARAGAAFFTTQIVFDAESTFQMLRQYDLLCRQASLAPVPVLLSFAPLVDELDAEFIRWLGVDIPEDVERAVLEGDGAGAVGRAVERAVSVWESVRRRSRDEELAVPLGVNVEQISARHLGDARTFLAAFAGQLES
jgi:5,10-methylenetetrahydrofolate reductase